MPGLASQLVRPPARGARFRAGSRFPLVPLLLAAVLFGSVLVGWAPAGRPTSPSADTALARAAATTSSVTSARGPAPAVQPRAGFTLTENSASPAAVGLSWPTTTDIFFNNYTVDFSAVGASGPWTVVSVITSSTTTTYVQAGMTPGASYWWQVIENGLFGTTSTNVLNVTQPTLAYLNVTQPTPTSASLTWTNNATYGSLIGFVSYKVYERAGTGSPSLAATITASATRNDTISGLSSGTGYAFFVHTTDCVLGCAGTTPTNSVTESNLVTVGTALPLTASIGLSRSVVDVGQLDLFTCSPAGGRSPFSFSWDLGNGTYVARGSTVSDSYAAPGPVTVTCLVTDAASTKYSAATSITVNSDPLLAASVNRSSADVGQSLAFSCSASLGTAPLVVSWTFGDGGGFAGGVQTHGYSTAGRYPAACSVTDQAGTTETWSTAVTVSPVLTALAASSSALAAPGTALSFTSHALNGSGTYPAFLWNFGDGSLATGSAATHAFRFVGTYGVTLRVNDTNGASTQALTQVKVSNVTVRLTAPVGTVDSGATMAFSANATGGAGGPYNFSWSFGDGKTAFGASVHHAYLSTGHYRPTVLVKDVLGGSNLSAARAVTVVAPPAAPLSPFVILILLLGVLVGVIVAVAHHRRASQVSNDDLSTFSGRVPPADPSRLVLQPKICRFCGSPNVPIRTTCETCGRPLPK